MHAIGGDNTILGRKNLTIYTAGTSEDILSIHGAHKADIIITDATLPLMGGAKLCSAIRDDAGLKDVSIILACDGTEESAAQCREARANAIISKPIEPVQLFSKISELLMVPERLDMRTVLNVSLKGEGKKSSFLGVSHNISISGMLLEAECVLKKGDLLSCAFRFGHREIVADAVVMRTNKQASGRFRYGVKFLNLDMKSLIIIEQFVKGGIKP